MPFNSNFNPVQFVTPEGVEVTGTSQGPEGGELMYRGVALQQDEHLVHGEASQADDWKTTQHFRGFVAGAEAGKQFAMALGTETYLMTSQDPTSPAFATFSWAQRVELR
jgi:hypothetical protein